MATLPATDISQARQYFDRTQKHVLEVTEGLSEAQWKFKPAPDRWSIAEILEHMVIVHGRVRERIFGQLPQAPPPPESTDLRKIDAIILEKIPDRSIKAKAPAVIEPTGHWALSEARDRLSQSYVMLLEIVESTPDLRAHSLDAPPLRVVTEGAYTAMDGYQWALTAAAHDQRHARQILEVKADPHYPRALSTDAAGVA